MSLRLRLTILLSILFFAVILAAGFALSSNTRANVGAESRASLGLVRALALEATCAAGVSPASVAAIEAARHLRVARQSRAGASGDRRRDVTPRWFARMVSPVELPAPVELRVATDARSSTVVEISAAPEDEIDEAWDDLAESMTYALALFAVLCVTTAILVTRELAPLAVLGDALRRVEAGALDTRMPHATLPEIEHLCVGFNRMAHALGEAQRANRELTRRMLGLQEAERRALARELHDEFGQHLTAIRADAAALLGPRADVVTAQRSGRAIEDTASTLMGLLRSMLERLRPASLDDLGLCVAMEDLVAGFRARNPDMVVSLDLPSSVDLDEERAIALYRVAQEALTNVARHAHASRVLVRLISDPLVELRVEDDGRGIADHAQMRGFGLLGMRERMDSCGGALEVARGGDASGTSIRARFPGGQLCQRR